MNKQRIAIFLLVVLAGGALVAYWPKSNSSKGSDEPTETETTTVLKPAPVFNADSAMAFTAKQVAFGPRVPGTQAHRACAAWLVQRLKGFGATVIEQNFTATYYDGKSAPAKNIIASLNPAAPKRILLAAHWDTRPIADKDDERKDKPIDGAIDGATGVGVLLEIARVISSHSQKPQVGIDFIFFDAEDNGQPEGYQTTNNDPTQYWCLGSQYWAKNLHQPGYSAYFGILVDLIGAADAQYPREGLSMQYAPEVLTNVWRIAKQLGYGNYFLDQNSGAIIDDHQFVNEVAKIPMIDIIDLRTNGSFGAYHHTHDDNLKAVNINSLKAVGQTVVQVLYQE
jgi:glutaminyl-peptide cyclotransferase